MNLENKNIDLLQRSLTAFWLRNLGPSKQFENVKNHLI